MSSGADLFVVCKQCGSEVSPYITECPYCGHRLRRRAPKLPRENGHRGARRGLARRLRWRRARVFAKPSTERGAGRLRWARDGVAISRPYATISLVALSCGAWVAWHARPSLYGQMVIAGPLRGDWWKLLTTQFAYGNGWYAFVALVAVALFGWLLERRHGPVVVVALFLGAGVTGALAASAVYAHAIISGANGAALGLLTAWVIPDLHAARTGLYYEGDLLAAGAIAIVLLALPLARPEASWLAGVSGGAVGLLVGQGLGLIGSAET
jgi:membrane associated rhomboid family serine protease